MTIRLLAGTLALAAMVGLAAQEPVPVNGFEPDEDVRLGRESAQIVRQALPILRDRSVQTYLRGLGTRLVRAVPIDRRQSAFRYTFEVIDVSDFLALALPGGPIFVSRGILEAAPDEAALAALLAHQISHVALRHGTEQTTRGEMFEVVGISGQLLGAVPGALLDAPAPADGGVGLSVYLLRYDLDRELEARRLAAAIVARAGFDVAAAARIFDTIARDGGAHGAAAWLADHPGAADDGGESQPPAGAGPPADLRARLRKMPRPPTAAAALSARAIAAVPLGPLGVDVPSGESRQVWVGNVLRMEIPENWRRYFSPSSVVFAPRGAAFENERGATAFSHGLQVGVALRSGESLEGDMGTLLRHLAAGKPRLRWAPAYQRTRLGGLPALITAASNVTAETGRFEYISVAAAHLDDSRVLFVIGIAPQIESGTYRGAFTRVRSSIRRIDDAR